MDPSFPFLSALFFLTLLLSQSFPIADATIEETCKAAVEKDPSVSYKFCVGSLLRHPHSISADTQGLGVIAVQLNADDAGHTMHLIGEKLKKPVDLPTESSLKQCYSLYDDMTYTLALALDDVNSRKYNNTRFNLETAIREAQACERAYAENKKPSPFTKENSNSVALSKVAIAITKVLG